jgi:hypothetical protein
MRSFIAHGWDRKTQSRRNPHIPDILRTKYLESIFYSAKPL